MRMKTLMAAALAGSLLTLAPAMAQTTPPQDPPPLTDLYTDADAAAVLDARLIALKTVVKLTPEQEKLWAPVEAAIRAAAKNAAERRATRAKAAVPQSFVDLLERTADAEIARANELKTVAAALKPLVASLTEEQRRRIPSFLGLREPRLGVAQPTAELWLFEEEN